MANTQEPHIPLPGCDVELPLMGLGTWAWGDKATWGMNGYDRSYGSETIREAYQRSVAAGITLLDTAELYGAGESERIIGRLRMRAVHLYQIHAPVSLRSHKAMAAALAVAQRSGLVKAVGVSNYSEREMRALHAELAKQGIPLATNQIEARRRLRWHPTG